MADGDEADRKVGYGKPPKDHQFRKGQSGNPGGRPKRHGRVKVDFERILDAPISIESGGAARLVQPREVALRRQLEKAVKGDLPAIKYLFQQFEKHDAIDWPEVQVCGVLTLPNTMPWTMALLLGERFGTPPWNKKELAAGRSAYLKIRSETERIEDEAIGYEILK